MVLIVSLSIGYLLLNSKLVTSKRELESLQIISNISDGLVKFRMVYGEIFTYISYLNTSTQYYDTPTKHKLGIYMEDFVDLGTIEIQEQTSKITSNKSYSNDVVTELLGNRVEFKFQNEANLNSITHSKYLSFLSAINFEMARIKDLSTRFNMSEISIYSNQSEQDKTYTVNALDMGLENTQSYLSLHQLRDLNEITTATKSLAAYISLEIVVVVDSIKV